MRPRSHFVCKRFQIAFVITGRMLISVEKNGHFPPFAHGNHSAKLVFKFWAARLSHF